MLHKWLKNLKGHRGKRFVSNLSALSAVHSRCNFLLLRVRLRSKQPQNYLFVCFKFTISRSVVIAPQLLIIKATSTFLISLVVHTYMYVSMYVYIHTYICTCYICMYGFNCSLQIVYRLNTQLILSYGYNPPKDRPFARTLYTRIPTYAYILTYVHVY